MRHRAEYIARINRVLDHIEAHLDEELPLERLARVAHFSPFHFHRIFGALMGERLQRFIQRLRLERAAVQLLFNPDRSVTEIAFDNGFASSATFARAFRNEFEHSASAWRKLGQTNRKMGKMDSKLSKGGRRLGSYVVDERKSTMTNDLNMKVEVRELAPQRVAYLRHIGPYQGDSELFGRLFGKLARWAGPRGLLGPDTKFLCIYHDNPTITAPDKLRISVCVPIPDDSEVSGEIGSMMVAGGSCAVGRVRIDVDQYADAWSALVGGWLPDSGYQPDDRPGMERYLNNPQQDPEHKHEVEICLPVRPL